MRAVVMMDLKLDASLYANSVLTPMERVEKGVSPPVSNVRVGNSCCHGVGILPISKISAEDALHVQECLFQLMHSWLVDGPFVRHILAPCAYLDESVLNSLMEPFLVEGRDVSAVANDDFYTLLVGCSAVLQLKVMDEISTLLGFTTVGEYDEMKHEAINRARDVPDETVRFDGRGRVEPAGEGGRVRRRRHRSLSLAPSLS